MISSELHRPSPRAQPAASLRRCACSTRGRYERKVASHLDSRSIETFLPIHRLDVQWSDRRKTATRPMFSSDVFARFRESDLPQVLSTRGLVTILRAGDRLAPIPDEAIDGVAVLRRGRRRLLVSLSTVAGTARPSR